MALGCWGWGGSRELRLQEATPSGKGTRPTVAVPGQASRNASQCRAGLLLSHSTSGFFLVAERSHWIWHGAPVPWDRGRKRQARQGGWERTRLHLGKGQNGSLGKQPRLARAGEGADVPRGCGGCTTCSPVQLG